MATAMDVDRSLDDIIASKPGRKGRNPRGGARSASGVVLGTPRNPARPTPAAKVIAAAHRARAQAQAQAQAQVGGVVGVNAGVGGGLKQATSDAFKVIVSNLPVDVEEGAVRELFVTTVGKVRSVELAYDSKGKSKGVATVIFVAKGDAQRAYDSYNNRMIDQKRPLKVEVVLDPSKVPLAARVAPLPVPVVAPVVPIVRASAGPIRRGGIRGGKRGGRGGGRPAPKTAAELDKEMLEYVSGGATPAA